MTAPRWLGPATLPAPGDMRARDRLRLVAEILAIYVPSALAVRRGVAMPEHLAHARARTAGRPAAPPGREHELAVRLGHIVTDVLDRLPTDRRCLVRSLVLVRLLARRSIDARLVIGVNVDEGFRAHAWVEHEDQPLLPVGAHTPLTQL